MKKRLIFLLICLFIVLTACQKNDKTTFITGNLKLAQENKMSQLSDYEKDIIKINDCYADNDVFSFVMDISKMKQLPSRIKISDSSNNEKFCDIINYNGGKFVITCPDYEEGDRVIVYNDEKTVTAEFSDFFPGITATEEKLYSSESTFLYNKNLYRVCKVTKHFGFYIVEFDRNQSDPKDLKPTVYDNKLENKSSYFINDYKMYLTDFPDLEKCFYFKFDDNPNIMTIEFN